MRRRTASRDTPVAVHGRSNDSIASTSVRCAVRPPLLFSPPGPGLVARGDSPEALDMTIYEQNRERSRQEVYTHIIVLISLLQPRVHGFDSGSADLYPDPHEWILLSRWVCRILGEIHPFAHRCQFCISNSFSEDL